MEKIKIILIDDDIYIQKLVKSVLSDEKFELILFSDAESIVERITKYKPDIVLLDIKLHGKSGIDAIKEIKENKEINSIPIIAFTSYTMKGDKEKFLNIGYDGYIGKPIDTHTFEGEILKYLK